jgi:co-chaperonin GroES (HSP10)
MKPVNKFVFIEPIMEEKVGGLYIPIQNNLPYKKGIVLRPSDQVTQVSAGDKVVYFKRNIACEKIERDGKFYDLVNEEALMYIE